MRPHLLVVLTLFVLSAAAQPARIRIFERTEYINGNIYLQTFDTVRSRDPIVDVYFLKKYFGWPYYLPERFFNRQYRNRKMTYWKDAHDKKDPVHNAQTAYTYDSLGRMISFSFSGCTSCSVLPYNYTVTYNQKGQIEQIANNANLEEKFRFYYNKNGDVGRFEKYVFNKLNRTMVLIE